MRLDKRMALNRFTIGIGSNFYVISYHTPKSAEKKNLECSPMHSRYLFRIVQRHIVRI